MGLLASATAIAIGIAILLPAYETPNGYVFFLCWFVGGPIIGFGLFTPFGRPVFGAIVGLAVQITILAVMFLLYLMHPAIG